MNFDVYKQSFLLFFLFALSVGMNAQTIETDSLAVGRQYRYEISSWRLGLKTNLLAKKKKFEQVRQDLDPLDKNYDMKFDSYTASLDEIFDQLQEVEKVIESTERKIKSTQDAKKTKE